jgi:uncharacterized protein YciI
MVAINKLKALNNWHDQASRIGTAAGGEVGREPDRKRRPTTMPYYIVINERGTAWDWSRSMREQRDWDAHALFMDELVQSGFILAGGPLGPEDAAARVLHAVEADDSSTIEQRMAGDPWIQLGLLRRASIEPWTILLGGFAPR